MKYLGFDEDYLVTKGAIHTAQEISFQPQLWKMIYQTIEGKRKEIKEYIHVALEESQKIYLTGAGTSAYIGLSLKGAFQRNLLTDTESLPTTDIVTHPQDYFIKEKSIILVSFARSGNSPESIAAAKAADKYCRKCFHLIITCNPEGQLANFSTK
ncbi:MAG TPA: SIS domain-containing protein, partial [Bacteroidales bacterium]|nr:SIS domain-containing protein [Bacteroidales bacterium]